VAIGGQACGCALERLCITGRNAGGYRRPERWGALDGQCIASRTIV
jgi:hypothetical protein